jgi:S-adenosylmethionine decarboxylase proenzyme
VIDTRGRHLLVEYTGCAREVLDDREAIQAALERAARAAGATVVGELFHRFTPEGVSVVVLIKESHLSIHTWPREGYAAVDFYTCGESDPERAHEVLFEELRAGGYEMMSVRRGEGRMAVTTRRASE